MYSQLCALMYRHSAMACAACSTTCKMLIMAFLYLIINFQKIVLAVKQKTGMKRPQYKLLQHTTNLSLLLSMHMYYICLVQGGLNTLTPPATNVMAKVLSAVPGILSLPQIIHYRLIMHTNAALAGMNC